MPHRTFKDVLPCSCACTWHITHCHFEQLHLWLGLNDEDLIIINNNNNNGFVAPLGPKIQRRLMQHRTKWVWIDRFSSGVWKWECFRTVECQQVESSRWMDHQQKKRDGSVRCVCEELFIFYFPVCHMWWTKLATRPLLLHVKYKTEWRLISATLCGWRRCFVADQLWFMTYTRGRRIHSIVSYSWDTCVMCYLLL